MSSPEVNSKPALAAPPSARPRFRIPNIRWWIGGLLLFAAVKNYIDRQLMSILAPTIQHDLGISDDQYANIISWFLGAYTIAYVLSGRLVDRLGTRISMALFVVWWSVSNALTSVARSVMSLSIFRFSLGLGEAGCWTASPKAVSEWFPARERAVAIGLYSMGAPIGAVIAALIAKHVGPSFPWQAAFVVTGALGLVWVIPWLWLYRRPADHPNITPEERAVLAEVIAASQAMRNEPRESEWKLWGEVIRQPAVWLLMTARLLTDPVWYFFQFWMPKFLNTVHHLETQQLSIMWIVYLTADLGFITAGFMSGMLIKRGVSAPAGRLWIMLASACLVPLAPLIALAPSVWACLGISMVVVMAATAYLSNLSALVVDIVPKRILGTSFGLIGGGSAVGGILMSKGVGKMIGAFPHGYTYCFIIMMALHPLATALIWRLRRAKTY